MKILIISTNRSQLPVPVMPLGACLVASAAERAGHDVRVVDLMFERNPLRTISDKLKKFRPEIVGLSVRNIDNNDMKNPAFFIEDIHQIVKTLRSKTDAEIVLGGAAISVMPEEIMRHTGVSTAVTGDGEFVFPELLARRSAGSSLLDVSGVVWIENETYGSAGENLGKMAGKRFPADFRKWVDIRRYLSRLSAAPVQTKLGCAFHCIYCTYRKIEGGVYRYFDREEVLDGIKRLAADGMKDIEFVDNVFNHPYEHAVSLCEDLLRMKSRLRLCSLELNPRFIDDHLIGLMVRAGFRGIGITVESASGVVLDRLGKGYSTDSVYTAAEVVRRHQLPCLWIFMLGGPGETETTLKETLRFAERHIRPGDTAFFNAGIRIYPGTELESVARRQGVLNIREDDMLRPVFYLSPDIDIQTMSTRVKASMDVNMNFIDSDSIGLSFLPALHRLGYRLGIRSPLWKYTRHIRRGLRFAGVEA
jgi:radical SAM superfamily enzyme YgiQ (UPF0313 family)